MVCRARRTGRWTDRVEDATAWILLAAGLLVVLLGGVFGIAVHDRLTDQARAEALDREPAVATLLNAAPSIGSDSTLSMPVEVAATWRDRAGVPHTGTVPAPQGLEADRTVQIWIDRSGAAVSEPTSDGVALEIATITAAITVLGGAIVLAALWCVVRRITLSCNLRGMGTGMARGRRDLEPRRGHPRLRVPRGHSRSSSGVDLGGPMSEVCAGDQGCIEAAGLRGPA